MLLEIGPPVIRASYALQRKLHILLVIKHLEYQVILPVLVKDHLDVGGHRHFVGLPGVLDGIEIRGLDCPAVDTHQAEERHYASVVAEAQAGGRAFRDVLVHRIEQVVQHTPGSLPRPPVAFIAPTLPDVVLEVVAFPEFQQFIFREEIIESRIFFHTLPVTGKVEEFLHKIQFPADLRRIQEIPADECVHVDLPVAVFYIRTVPVPIVAAVVPVECSGVRGIAGLGVQERKVGITALLPYVEVRPFLLEDFAEGGHTEHRPVQRGTESLDAGPLAPEHLRVIGIHPFRERPHLPRAQRSKFTPASLDRRIDRQEPVPQLLSLGRQVVHGSRLVKCILDEGVI